MKPVDRKATLRWIDPTELRPVDENEPERGEVPVEGATTWLLRPLSKRARSYCQDIAAYVRTKGDLADVDTIAPEIETRTGSVKFWAVKFGLFGVENFPGWETEKDPLGLLPSGESVPTDGFLDTIDDEIFDRMAAKIQSLSTVTGDDAEKSSPPSTSSSTMPSSPDAGSVEPSA